MSAWESVLAAELSSHHHVTTRKRLQRLGHQSPCDRRAVPARPTRAHRPWRACLPIGTRDVRASPRRCLRALGRGNQFPTAGKVRGSARRPRKTVHVTIADARRRSGAGMDRRPCARELPVAAMGTTRRHAVTSPPPHHGRRGQRGSIRRLESLIEQGIERASSPFRPCGPTLTARGRQSRRTLAP